MKSSMKLPNKTRTVHEYILLYRTQIALVAIILLGGLLRFYNLNWDQGHFFHPDERNIAGAVSKIRFFTQLNPHFFAYGGLPHYLYRAVGEILAKLTDDPAWVSNWSLINLVGRGVSAFVSSVSTLLVFLLGKKVFDKKTGLLAAFFTAFCVSLIQTAHYGVTESLLTFWGLLIALLSFKLLEKPIPKNYLVLGLVSGLAVGTKVSAATFLLFPTLAHLLSGRKNFLKKQFFFSVFLLFVAFFFLLSSPYTLLDFEHFKESMTYEASVASGKPVVCYVYQFLKTKPYIFQIKNLPWLMGPLLALFSLAGFALLLTKVLKRKILLLISWPLVYALIVGSWYAKFIRYMVPLLPFFCILAAWFLIEIKNRWHRVGCDLLLLSILTTTLYALSFMSIYAHENTRITASKWVFENVPSGSKILTEHWDTGLPVGVNGHNPSMYETEQLTIYDEDNSAKAGYYAEKLSGADYITISSRRLYGTLINLPEKYPITSKYYKLLFSGELGYNEVAKFTSYPRLLGIELNDDGTEETFQVFDHPKVMVFENVEHLLPNQLRKIILND